MLIQYGQALGDYLYDVFVAKFDFWLAFGLVAQLLFTARFLVQWISSERAGRSVIPIAFWFFSMGGGLMTLVGLDIVSAHALVQTVIQAYSPSAFRGRTMAIFHMSSVVVTLGSVLAGTP